MSCAPLIRYVVVLAEALVHNHTCTMPCTNPMHLIPSHMQSMLDERLASAIGATTATCDSSECIICCAGPPACTTTRGKLCNLLRKRSLSLGGGSFPALDDVAHACHPTHACGHAKRPRGRPCGTWRAAAPPSQLLCRSMLPEWRWVESQHAHRPDAPPVSMAQLLSLSHTPPGAHDVICSLEFSPDGKLLAAGSTSKQVRGGTGCRYQISQGHQCKDSLSGRSAW